MQTTPSEHGATDALPRRLFRDSMTHNKGAIAGPGDLRQMCGLHMHGAHAHPAPTPLPTPDPPSPPFPSHSAVPHRDPGENIESAHMPGMHVQSEDAAFQAAHAAAEARNAGGRPRGTRYTRRQRDRQHGRGPRRAVVSKSAVAAGAAGGGEPGTVAGAAGVASRPPASARCCRKNDACMSTASLHACAGGWLRRRPFAQCLRASCTAQARNACRVVRMAGGGVRCTAGASLKPGGWAACEGVFRQCCSPGSSCLPTCSCEDVH